MRRFLSLGALTLCLYLFACTPISETAVPAEHVAQQVEGPSALSLYLESREAPGDSTGIYRPFVAVFPFEDDTDFPENIWDLENSLARSLTAEMSGSALWRVVPYAAVADAVKEEGGDAVAERYAAANILRTDIALIGTLLDYNMERFSAGDPLVGGYKSYTGIAEIDLQVIRVGDRTVLSRLYSKRERTDRGLGLDLLGKPRARDEQFVGLSEMPFDSEEFKATGIGQATQSVMEELVEKLSRTLRPKGITLADGGQAQILSVYGEEIFINIGSENGVYIGQRFEVLATVPETGSESTDASRTRLSVVQIQDIIGGKVSKVKALYAIGRISVGDTLRLIGVDDDAGGGEAP